MGAVSSIPYVYLDPNSDSPASQKKDVKGKINGLEYGLNELSRIFNEAAKMLGFPVTAEEIPAEKNEYTLRTSKEKISECVKNIGGNAELKNELFCEIKGIIKKIKWDAENEPDKLTESTLDWFIKRSNKTLEKLKFFNV